MKIRLSGSLVSVVLLLSAGAINANPQPSGSAISILSAPVTISQPGTYRLANDVTGQITIDANNVELNLDNRKITAATNGVSVTSHDDVVIKNGIIEGGTNGINVLTCTNIEISDVDFIDNATGINILTVKTIQVDNCNFRGFTSEALCIGSSKNGHFSNCIMNFNSNSSRVVNALNSSNFVFEKVLADNNSHTGPNFKIFALNNCQNFFFNECQANNNSYTGGAAILFRGFSLETNCKNIKHFNCRCNHNSADTAELVGFFIDKNGEDILYEHCCANNNLSSSNVAGFFIKTETKKTIIKSCIASNNDGNTGAVGFRADISCDKTCIIDCIAKENTSLVALGIGISLSISDSCLVQGCSVIDNKSIGILLSGCADCLVKSNNAIGNGSIGIEVNNTGLSGASTGVVSNYSSGHTSNYTLVGGGLIQLADLSFSAGTIVDSVSMVKGDVSKWHNIKTVP